MSKLAGVILTLLAIFHPNIDAQSVPAAIELNQGVQAYKQARYEEAVQHFQKAVSLDPEKVEAHLYLATALAQQYIPGVESAENLSLGKAAIDQYQNVLDLDPKSINAVKGIAYLDLQMKKFEDAKQYYRNAIELDPNDAESYYSVGVVAWTQAYQQRMEIRANLALKPEEPLIDTVACAEVRAEIEDRVKDGIEMLVQALKLRPDYDDAMAYMNLMYRERADIQCGDRRAYGADLKTADIWVDMTIATKKAKSQDRQKSSQPDQVVEQK